ncbi:hypothetical protein UM93_03860 [Psychromicrobium lacuslunae]|uniref:FAD-dependent urate hydroxylase HpyO/Asp monooxygenase CreE-like FAD/NAD(P)-binding domain-containing protein n=1 Tax=Psychromicrobium lacuslunae TaxID=1618207 RepID=A0A0D4C372_9MICC|nr:hypothetical protein UM93_03860 [Psychromicrobium lacuslunae]
MGGGPRTAGILERLASNLTDFPSTNFTIHIFDPFEPGSGRIWRREQSPLLRLNSTAADVTMFTDSSLKMAGPVAAGPNLFDWAVAVRNGSVADLEIDDAALWQELLSLRPGSFPSRRLHAEYLQWSYRKTVRKLAPRAVVIHHPFSVKAIETLDDGREKIRFSEPTRSLVVDAAVLALGHTDAVPDQQSEELLDFAQRHQGWYLPPCYTADSDLSAVQPGQPVLVRGLGLAFIDLMVLLMQGRGGQFRENPDGSLKYLPSGREPRLLVGSRRGVPYHSKTPTVLHGEPFAPRFFSASVIEELLLSRELLDFDQDLWPLISKELLYGYYRELSTGHPERLNGHWTDIQRLFEAPGLPARSTLQKLLSDPADYLDLNRLDRPFEDTEVEDLQGWLRNYILTDLERQSTDQHSEAYGLFLALLSCYGALVQIPHDRLSLDSHRKLRGRWHSFFSFLASGPPPRRLQELLALQEAGLIEFLGPEVRIDLNELSGCFEATSAWQKTPRSAKALIDAFLPRQDARYSVDPLISAGATADRVQVDGQNRVLNQHGASVLNRFAVGAFTDSMVTGAFPRPGSNAPVFRDNDALARRLLELIAAPKAAQPQLSERLSA